MLTDDVMLDIVAPIIGQVIGVLLWAALLNAPILQWRARKLKNWSIRYKHAYLVSIKAGFIAVVLPLSSRSELFGSYQTWTQFNTLLGLLLRCLRGGLSIQVPCSSSVVLMVCSP